MDRYRALANRLGYDFQDPQQLIQALTHRSAGSRHNERLEFLGDAVLNFVVAAELYQRHPAAREGELSRLRASLVKGKTLADVAAELGLGDFLRLGPGELKSGGFRRESILAGAMEAVIGAVYEDGGFDASRRLVLSLLDQRLNTVSPGTLLKDPKTRLQEWLQGQRRPLPAYRVKTVDGSEHAQTFVVECMVDGISDPFVGVGSNRRAAEQEAAAHALSALADSAAGADHGS